MQDLNLKAVADVKNVAKLASSKAFQDCVKVCLSMHWLGFRRIFLTFCVCQQQVQEYRNKPPTDISGSESPEYKLIVQANNYAVEIDNDILMVHKVSHMNSCSIDTQFGGCSQLISPAVRQRPLRNPLRRTRTVCNRTA